MAFSYKNSKGQTYFLNSKDVTLKSTGRVQTIYFFSKDERDTALNEVPSGKKVVENERTGLPFLKKA
jgi:hypothetical protein